MVSSALPRRSAPDLRAEGTLIPAEASRLRGCRIPRALSRLQVAGFHRYGKRHDLRSLRCWCASLAECATRPTTSSRSGLLSQLVWPSLAQNGIALDLANSFLVLASNSAQDRSDPNVLAYHFSTDRVDAYCKETRFVRSTSGAIELHYYSLAPRPARNDASALLKFSLPDKAVYRAGTVLSKELIDVVTRDGWRIEDVGAFLRRFLQIATALAAADREPLSIDSSLQSCLESALT